jgi:anti-anti-sigma regulatory factor
MSKGMQVFSVVLPFQLAESDRTVHTLQVNAVAIDAESAVQTATLLGDAWSALRHPGATVDFKPARTKAMSDAPIIDGPFAYVLSNLNQIYHLALPSRIDGEPGERLGHLLSGLSEKAVYGVVIDCSHLAYINTVGLTSIATHLKRLKLQLYDVPETIQKVLDIVGLSKLLSIHATLTAALAAIVAACDNGSGPIRRK